MCLNSMMSEASSGNLLDTALQWNLKRSYCSTNGTRCRVEGPSLNGFASSFRGAHSRLTQED
jgi:hypothetical protein